MLHTLIYLVVASDLDLHAMPLLAVQLRAQVSVQVLPLQAGGRFNRKSFSLKNHYSVGLKLTALKVQNVVF